MPLPELAHLKLLAEIDTLVERLRHWADGVPPWPPAETCRAVVRRVVERAASLRVRLDAPLVVATLGGSGTGKSALVNALLGAEVVLTGRQRPTTARPALVCRPDLGPEVLGIDPHSVEVLHRDLPALAELVLVDCPDPDTTEESGDQVSAASVSNLARLRRILPHCDVLLVTTTQQKYRSARVAEELAAAASGARLVFVQTHADRDEDIRDDWRGVLDRQHAPGRVFLVDSLAALADAEAGLAPRGEFAALTDLLTRQLAGAAAARIRRANLLDLVEDTLRSCRELIDGRLPAVQQVLTVVEAERTRLAAGLAQQIRAELLASRRPWEGRLLAQAASRWGLSPFALVLRLYQGLGGLLMGSLLWRARTPVQMALWGALSGVRTWQTRRQDRQADKTADRALGNCWDQSELRAAALVLGGYATEAGLPREAVNRESLAAEARQAGAGFVATLADGLETIIARLAARHTGWLTRCCYEFFLAAMLGMLLWRLGKNFFYDSWLAEPPLPVFGLEFYLSAGFWLVLWCLFLIWAFTGRLRRGLRREIDQLANGWQGPTAATGLFSRLEDECRRVAQFRHELDQLEQHVTHMRRQLPHSGA